MTTTSTYVVWRYRNDVGVLAAPTEGEARARLRVERGPEATVVEVLTDWPTAYAHGLLEAAGGPVQHQPDADCECFHCRAYREATCGRTYAGAPTAVHYLSTMLKNFGWLTLLAGCARGYS